jgi:hypothetical protein
MQNRLIKKRKPLPLLDTAMIEQRNVVEEPKLEEADNELSDPHSEGLLREPIMDPNAVGPREYLLAQSDDEGQSTGEQRKEGKKKLKITVPTVSYKFVKESMFPDSRVKNDKFLRTPYGISDLEDKLWKDNPLTVSPLMSKKGTSFLHMTFSPSGLASGKHKELTPQGKQHFSLLKSDQLNDKMNNMVDELKHKIMENTLEKK